MNKKVILCDLDGTLANLEHRLHYIKNPDGTMKPRAERDWDGFNKACVDDAPYEDVMQIVKALTFGRSNGCGSCGAVEREVYILSGRNEVVRDETIQWLQKTRAAAFMFFDYATYLVMRKADDRRPDTEVKLDMVRQLGLTPDDVLCVLDDRQCVVDMWRENGFRCLQVNAWEE